MPISSITKDTTALTMTIVADFPVPLRRLWDAYADPRQLEQFWGPREWPATFTRHDLYPGGWSHYVMRGPGGQAAAGYWRFEEVDAPHRFTAVDGFSSENGEPDPALPTVRMVFDFSATPGGSRLTTTTYFNSVDELEQLLGMGMEEGTRSAMSQIDAVLADLREYAAGRATQTQILSETQVRISRIIRGPRELVWNAHHDRDQLQVWLLGPDGWQMPVCEVATTAGDEFRYEWALPDGSQRFGFTGELLQAQPPHRSVTTERMIGTDGPQTVNEMTLTPVAGGTLLSLVITYPDADARDMVLETGMAEGMEVSYARLETAVLAPEARPR